MWWLGKQTSRSAVPGLKWAWSFHYLEDCRSCICFLSFTILPVKRNNNYPKIWLQKLNKNNVWKGLVLCWALCLAHRKCSINGLSRVIHWMISYPYAHIGCCCFLTEWFQAILGSSRMQADRGARRIMASLLDWSKVNEQGMRVSVPG